MLKILEDGENQFVEFKLSFQKEVIESIVAFSNAKDDRHSFDDITIEKLNTNNYSSRTRNRVIAPIFEEFVHGFRVIIYKEKLINNDVGVNVGTNDIFQFIQKHQPINVNNIALNYQEVTKRTIERWIKQLKEENKIEFRGSKKTGGYYEV
jgi:ATP-dependent DNA helicase RecG